MFVFLSLFNNKNTPASSIASILSGISHTHKIRGVLDPTHTYPVNQMLIAIRKTGTKPDKRKSITETLLFTLLTKMNLLGLSTFEISLFKAMFLFAFYFGLRIGEIPAFPVSK